MHHDHDVEAVCGAIDRASGNSAIYTLDKRLDGTFVRVTQHGDAALDLGDLTARVQALGGFVQHERGDGGLTLYVPRHEGRYRTVWQYAAALAFSAMAVYTHHQATLCSRHYGA